MTEAQKHCYCPYCEEELQESDSPFCQACKTTINYCPECKTPVSRDQEVCPKCGSKLKALS